MASTFSAGKVAAGIQPRANLGLNCVSETYDLTAALVVNDVIQMVKIPAGAIIQDVILRSDDIDDGAAAILAVGDGGSAGRFIAASNIGQAGGIARLDVASGHKYQYSAEDTIDVKCTTAPATGTYTGKKISLTVFYSFEE